MANRHFFLHVLGSEAPSATWRRPTAEGGEATLQIANTKNANFFTFMIAFYLFIME